MDTTLQRKVFFIPSINIHTSPPNIITDRRYSLPLDTPKDFTSKLAPVMQAAVTKKDVAITRLSGTQFKHLKILQQNIGFDPYEVVFQVSGNLANNGPLDANTMMNYTVSVVIPWLPIMNTGKISSYRISMKLVTKNGDTRKTQAKKSISDNILNPNLISMASKFSMYVYPEEVSKSKDTKVQWVMFAQLAGKYMRDRHNIASYEDVLAITISRKDDSGRIVKLVTYHSDPVVVLPRERKREPRTRKSKKKIQEEDETDKDQSPDSSKQPKRKPPANKSRSRKKARTESDEDKTK
jgi:hypothetical protein